MPNILDAKIRRVTGIPILLKREDAQQQIEIPGHSISAARARRPNLRRDILDEFRLPIKKGSLMGLEILLDCVGKSAIESSKINTNNCVWLPLYSQSEQLMENPPEPKENRNDLHQPNYGVPGHF